MIELWVNNIEIPVQAGERIVVKKSNAQIGKLNSRQGTFSNDFTVPMTAEVIKAFDYSDRNESDSTFPYTVQSATLQRGGVVVEDGSVRLTAVNYLKREFTLHFVSGNTTWINAIGDMSIQDIYTGDLQHTWDSDAIVASFVNRSGYIYPVIDYGSIDESTWTPSGDGFNEDEMFPAMFWKTIITRGLESVGIKVGGSFTNSWEWDHEVIPFSAGDFVNISNASASAGDTVDPGGENLPDIKLVSLIKDMVIKYGLVTTFDNATQTLHLDSFQYIISRTNQAIDWSDKVDPLLTTQVNFATMTQSYGKETWLKYKANHEDDIRADIYNRTPLPDLGNGKIDIDNEFLSDATDLYVSPFSGSNMYNVVYNFPFGREVFLMYISYIDFATGDRSLNHNARTCYVLFDLDVDLYSLNASGGANLSITGTTLYVRNTTPWAFFYKPEIGTALDDIKVSLSFGDSDPWYLSLPGRLTGERGLLERFYPEVSRILNRPRYINTSLRLREHEFQNADFTTPVYIDTNEIRGYFIIDIIEYDGEVAEVGLIQII